MSQKSQIGLYGLGTMGVNLAFNFASKGIHISGMNRSRNRTDDAVKDAEKQGISSHFHAYYDVKSFINSLSEPKVVIILVNSGDAVDQTIQLLKSEMKENDIIIDGGNEWWENTDRRGKLLEKDGIKYIGMGVSGGEEGARYGPSLMPGGPIDAVNYILPMLEKVAAIANGVPCVTYIGPGGSGNYVKMVHNGIEYGDMQLIAEAYDVLKNIGNLNNVELQRVFSDWNKDILKSYLIEITADIFKVKDEFNKDEYAVDYVLDKTGMKGTGIWTVRDAAQQGIAVPTIGAALTARQMSAILSERIKASQLLEKNSINIDIPLGNIENEVRDALFAAKICSYAQGLALISCMSKEHNWNLNIGNIAKIWRGGCIIRAQILDDITRAFEKNPSLENLILSPEFINMLKDKIPSLRRISALAVTRGIPVPAFTSSITYYDMYRSSRLPANLTQAQRDYFGAHTYQRIDREGIFHTQWLKLSK